MDEKKKNKRRKDEKEYIFILKFNENLKKQKSICLRKNGTDATFYLRLIIYNTSIFYFFFSVLIFVTF